MSQTQTQTPLAEKAKYYKLLQLEPATLAEVKNAGVAFKGFQSRKEFEAGKSDGLVLRLREEVACNLQISDTISLQDAGNNIIGVLTIEDKWIGYIPEANQRFGTVDEENEKVKALKAKGPIYFGGKVTLL